MNRCLFISVFAAWATLSAVAAGPRVSILGDSYSTFAGAIPAGNAIWYPCRPPYTNDVRKADQCWWSLVIARLGGTLERNESWSGSTVCNTGYNAADVCHNSFIARVMRLGNPDVILVCGGTNDAWARSPLGEFKYADWTADDLKAFRPALAKLLHDLKTLYPSARLLYILNDAIGGDYRDSTHVICDNCGVRCLDLKNIAKKNSHPSIDGMKSMAEQTLQALAAGGMTSGEDASSDLVYRAIERETGAKEVVLDLDKAGKYAKAPATAERDGDEYVLENGTNRKAQNGLHWNVPLDQKSAVPFVFEVESLFEAGSEGPATMDYSLYLDVRFTDGSSLYGQTYNFLSRKSRGWQRGIVSVSPDKPVKRVDCYCLLRNRDGRVRFRAPRMKIFAGTSDFTTFDTTQVSVVRDVAAPQLLIHDAAAEGDGWRAVRKDAEVDGVKVSFSRTAKGSAEFFDVKLASTSDADRALTVAYSIPLAEGPLDWLDDPRTTVRMGRGQYSNTVNAGCGAGGLSHWPFGAVRVGETVQALGYDPSATAIFRVVAQGDLRRLFIAFDIGLAKEKRDAHFRFVAFHSKGAEGFRGALARYAEIFPEAFRVRIGKHGIWMAAHPISKVERFEDFGFVIKEGQGETAWDDAHGILTTHYTEPTSWWMKMKTTNSVSWAEALAAARAEAAKPKPSGYAKAWLACTYRDEEGQITGALCDRPWCKGCVWNLNPLPAIPGGDYAFKLSAESFARNYDGKTFPDGVDGEYIDSAECSLPPRIDFNRANFQYAQTPLCWGGVAKKPGVATALAIYEYVRGAADRAHARGRIVQANGVPYNWPWLTPFVDYGGQETKWIEKGEGAWKPMNDRDLLYRMALSYGKPYCFLMNVKFEKMTDGMVEKYFQRCLAYGLLSSFFSPNASDAHYFSRPDLYNRHRKFFLKYGPLQRRLSEAGWRPVNRLVASEAADVFVEQFGERFVTVFNSGTEPRAARLRLLGETPVRAKELVTGEAWTFVGGAREVTIPPETCRLLDFGN